MRRITRNVQQRQQQRFLDDEDWGTSAPAASMSPPSVPPSPSVAPLAPSATAQPVPAVSPSSTPLTRAIPSGPTDRSLGTAIARLKQQDLKSYTCTFSPRCVVSIYFIIAITFLPLGASVAGGTARIASLNGYHKYDQDCQSTGGSTVICSVRLTEPIPKPSYLYYRLTNFHQNARDYVKSRSPIQNRGLIPSSYTDVANCERYLCDVDGVSNCTSATNFNASNIRYPCGLTARLVFNDTFKLCKDKGCKNSVNTTKENIAWWTDTHYKFRQNLNAPEFTKKRPQLFSEEDLPANDLLGSEDFVVWMRLAAFPTFDKLWAIITEDLEPNLDYYMEIENTFQPPPRGEKFFFITTTSWFGTRNVFLGIAYLVVGSIALFIAIMVLFKHIRNPNALSNADPASLLREHLAKLNVELDPYHQQ